jgi:lipopolysaccharide/colanic/teichoic acid biosynthesis glycosyltransferase
VLAQLAEVLKNRLRFTDEAGWLSDEEIGAVLPCTAVEGARSVANDICREFGEHDCPYCEIYFYPTEDLPQATGRRNGTTAHSHGPAAHAGVNAPCSMEPLFVQPMRAWKRGLDVAGSATALVGLIPLLAAVAMAIKVSSPGPVLFKQRRAGLGGKPFSIYKFRTMRTGAELLRQQLLERNEVDGPAFKIKDDPRVTWLGQFLRRTSIDELPQLWNVLKGDMSLVGPRPLPCEESAACSAWQKERLNVTPGLTCIWQVRGRSLVTFDEWMRMDLAYVETTSFATDLRILVATVPAVLFGKGAY